MTDLERAREFFYNDRFAAEATGIILEEVREHYSKCTLKIEKKHLNGLGNVMGGAIFTLADFAFAVAANFNHPNTVSSASQITFLSKAKGDQLIAETNLIKDGRTTCFYEVTVTDNLGTKVAFVTINGIKIV